MKLEELEYLEEGYKPMVDFESWRVAILNYIDELEPDQIDNLHVHYETDEVFSLLEGKCTLIFGDHTPEGFKNFKYVAMEKGKLYNVKKGQFHSHTLSLDGKVIIVENSNTNDSNTEHIDLTDDERAEIAGTFISRPL